ncbi:hypothetical protein B7P43_G13622 [Cryptotermes secundus]|uniref:Uncharacterized protein n=2 Tax=Cryptotermes secundus TaxID=105785 RepID=A0A2J7RPM0_9NEOP|nr:hypothetical protein B7P43_G13622 [Cryptotermes secundus]
MFKKDQIGGAVNKYKKAVSILENCHLKDEEEEAKQQNMLLKLYINLAVCYNKQKVPRLACVMCRNALVIQPRNVKALFNFGRALLMLSDFDQAKHFLISAQKIEPQNNEISNELKKLDKKRKTYEVDVKIFSQRLFSGTSGKVDNEPKSKKCVVSAEFENSARKFLTEFVNDSEKSQMPLPTGLTAQEEFCIRQTAEQLGLIIRSQGRIGEKLLYISKPEPE